VAKKQSFADKSTKKAHTVTCPVCQETLQYIRHVKAVKGDSGSWKFRSQNVGVCKCNNAEIYG
jgi:hypothetical protein